MYSLGRRRVGGGPRKEGEGEEGDRRYGGPSAIFSKTPQINLAKSGRPFGTISLRIG